jgi:hypothetical protein
MCSRERLLDEFFDTCDVNVGYLHGLLLLLMSVGLHLFIIVIVVIDVIYYLKSTPEFGVNFSPQFYDRQFRRIGPFLAVIGGFTLLLVS